jgi:RNA polymerase sigma factor (sigma-70 family)
VLDSTELAQCVLLKLQEPDVLERVATAEAPEAYLRRMVHNEATDLRRRQTIERRALGRLARVPQQSLPPDDSILERLGQEWDQLTQDEQQLLMVRFWEDRSIGEIADRLGIRYSTAAVRLFRLLHRLRKRLGDDAASR